MSLYTDNRTEELSPELRASLKLVEQTTADPPSEIGFKRWAARRVKALETQNSILYSHLDKMLSELEEYHKAYGKFESYEFADQYCEAAKAARQLGRKGDLELIVSEQMKTM